MKSHHIRKHLLDALTVDLIGPVAAGNDEQTIGDQHAREALAERPSRFYLTGFLVPLDTPEEERVIDGDADELDMEPAQAASSPEPDSVQNKPPSIPRYLPSSCGLSVLVDPSTTALYASLSWGTYTQHKDEVTLTQHADAAHGTLKVVWARTPHTAYPTIDLPDEDGTHRVEVPGYPHVGLHVTVRTIHHAGSLEDDVERLLPAGTRSVSVFIVNQNPWHDGAQADATYLFQVAMHLNCAHGFVARPNPRGRDAREELDERIADLQYRHVAEYATGHSVSARAHQYVDGDTGNTECYEVETIWLPQAFVWRTQARTGTMETRMSVLGEPGRTSVALRDDLTSLPQAYKAWIQEQFISDGMHQEREEVLNDLRERAELACARIERGIEVLLSDEDLRIAFATANRAMARAARQRRPGTEPMWRTFQLAFLLMNLPAMIDPHHEDREIVELIFFPTGGGKTEAYLGLAATSLVLRRLRHNGSRSGAGLGVLMRYTLRLLTLDQLERASAMIIALELERRAFLEQGFERLGDYPFEIGLWVGQGATPNRLGSKKDNKDYTAYGKLQKYQKNEKRNPSPIPLEVCPWCQQPLGKNSFKMYPSDKAPLDLHIHCKNRDCEAFSTRFGPLPIITVDEPLYRRLPAMIISTVDKFANLPWVGATGKLFGHVHEMDGHGYYGPSDPSSPGRTPLPEGLEPPDLILQDELHLISGPVGTMVGLYETMIEELCTRESPDGKKLRPKIVASTATIRRATSQVRALFARSRVEIFPPYGPSIKDSFFAEQLVDEEEEGRLYVGVSAQGRSGKVALLRTYLALLAAAQKAYQAVPFEDGAIHPADPYMTLLGYFNSLRELGGARRIIEDEVHARLKVYGRRRRLGEVDESAEFVDRTIKFEPQELTSRVPTNKIAEAKKNLALDFEDKDAVDIALASNMISVGLDITRLGLMVVQGQPKSAAEYIQATSRVGRDPTRPGLVITLFNVHRPRDRSHYERFETFHKSIYRHVEATSVTPFASRTIERGLPGVVVGLVRHLFDTMTPGDKAAEILELRDELEGIAKILSARALNHREAPGDSQELQRLSKDVHRQTMHLLDAWIKRAQGLLEEGGMGRLNYQRYEGKSSGARLLYTPLDPELGRISPEAALFTANRSLRSVEPSVHFRIRDFLGDS